MFDSGVDIDGSMASEGHGGMAGGMPMDDIMQMFFASQGMRGGGGFHGFHGQGFSGHQEDFPYHFG
jgi:hypothetical protein